MRKIIKNLLLIFIILIPFNINAKFDGISNYYIDAKVLENGDMHIKELFVLEGDYNGYERIINFANLDTMRFDGSDESYFGNDLHNARGIEIINVKSIAVGKDADYNHLYKKGEDFELKDSLELSKGDYGKYSIKQYLDGVVLTIYNPSTHKKRGFYVEYVLENIGIVHKDVAEIGWNLFSDLQKEDIKKLEMFVNIPNNKEEIRVWGHGPLTGEVGIVNKNRLSYNISNLPKGRAIDIRFIFDKDVISQSTKNSYAVSLDKIVKVETERAEIANKIREEAKEAEALRKKHVMFSDIALVLWLIGLGGIIYKVYHKYDKEYDSDFKTKYFRDFPNNYNPAVVNYLMKKKIATKELSAVILHLVAEKKIKYEEVSKNNFEFINNMNEDEVKELSDSEQALISMLFNSIGNGTRVSMKDINKKAKTDYNKFLNSYNRWKDLAVLEAEKENLFEDNQNIKLITQMYIIMGFGMLFLLPKPQPISSGNVLQLLLYGITLLSLIVSTIYNLSFTKRTTKGNELFKRWNGLKNFLNDFGKFEARDLPHVEIWEKYLVYAFVFGNAKQLSKTMEIKFKEMPANTYTTSDYMFNAYYFRSLSRMNDSVSNSVNNAVKSAVSAKSISESKASSGGGFGGGFSGGGGSFGGGGGGGRF